jgi:hypothetical protein
MQCLYTSDYGPPEPGFDAKAGNGQMLRGFEAQSELLSRAQNRGQLEAMKRKLARGESVRWCDQGYGWTYAPATTAFFDAALLFLILPWILLRILPRLRRRWAGGRIRPSPTSSEIIQ